MNQITQETGSISDIDNFTPPSDQPQEAIFIYKKWFERVVQNSRRPDNYTKQISKLENIKNIFKYDDPIKLISYWYFKKQYSVHYIANSMLGTDQYKEKALYHFLSKKLGWKMRENTHITDTGKKTLRVFSKTKKRVKVIFS